MTDLKSKEDNFFFYQSDKDLKVYSTILQSRNNLGLLVEQVLRRVPTHVTECSH